MKTFLNGNASQTIAIIICATLLVWVYSCQPQVASVLSPSQQVTRLELDLELETFIATAEIRYKDLKRQEDLRNLLFEHASLWASSGTINPLGVLMSIAALLGVGATADNVRKRVAAKKPPPA